MKLLILLIASILLSFQFYTINSVIKDIISYREIKEVPYIKKKTWVKDEIIEMIAYKAIENNLSPKYLIALAKCESNFNPNIRSRGKLKNGKQENSWGLFQSNLDAHKNLTIEQMKDPEINTEWAIKHIKEGKASQMWVTCNRYANSVK